MPTEEQIINNYVKDMQLEVLGYLMFVINTSSSLEEVKNIVQTRIDKLSKELI